MTDYLRALILWAPRGEHVALPEVRQTWCDRVKFPGFGGARFDVWQTEGWSVRTPRGRAYCDSWGNWDIDVCA